MKKVLADWRNWALVIAVVAIVYLAIAVNKAGAVDSSEPLVRIGDQRITEKAFIENVKAQVGDQALLAMMQRTLVEEYAKKEGVKVTDEDMEQLRNFHRMTAELLYGMSLDDMLKQQNITPEKFDLSLRLDILNIKLVVPDEEIEKFIQQVAEDGSRPFTYPERFKYRSFVFPNGKAAEEATALLKTEDGVEEAAKMSVYGTKSVEVSTYFSTPGQEDRLLEEMLEGLEPGDVSKPKSLQEGEDGMVVVVQLVDIIPEEKPTVENRNLAAGMVLLSNYPKEIARLEAKMMDSIEVFFYEKSQDYQKAVDQFKAKKLSNPNLPATKPASEAAEDGTIGASGGKQDGEPQEKSTDAPAHDAAIENTDAE